MLDKKDLRALQKWSSEKTARLLNAIVCSKRVASEAYRGICMHKNPIRVSVEREFFVLATTRKALTRYMKESGLDQTDSIWFYPTVPILSILR